MTNEEQKYISTKNDEIKQMLSFFEKTDNSLHQRLMTAFSDDYVDEDLVDDLRNMYHEFREVKELIKDELNVLDVEFLTKPPKGYSVKYKPNFKSLGKKFGKDTKTVADMISKSKTFPFEYNGIMLDNDDAIKIVDMPNDGAWTYDENSELIIGFDINVTPKLKQMYVARECKFAIQQARKHMNFAVDERISLVVNGDDFVLYSLLADDMEQLSYICDETLVEFVDLDKNLFDNEYEFDGHKFWFRIEKIDKERH